MRRVERRVRPTYDPETRAGAVALAKAGHSQRDIAKSLGCSDRQIRRWIKQSDIDVGKKPGLKSSERRELRLLRRANLRLQERALLLEQALDFFGRETR